MVRLLVCFGGVLTVAFYFVVEEFAVVGGAIFQKQFSFAIFEVVLELPLVDKLPLLLQFAKSIELLISELPLITLSLVLVHVLALHDRVVLKYALIGIAVEVFALALGLVELPVALVVAPRGPVHASFAVFHAIFDFALIDFPLLVGDFGSIIFHDFDAYVAVGFVGTGIFVHGEGDDLPRLGFLERLIFAGFGGFAFLADLCVAHAI